jgi:hypothetical protein
MVCPPPLAEVGGDGLGFEGPATVQVEQTVAFLHARLGRKVYRKRVVVSWHA